MLGCIVINFWCWGEDAAEVAIQGEIMWEQHVKTVYISLQEMASLDLS